MGEGGCDRAAQNGGQCESTQGVPETGKHTKILQPEWSSAAGSKSRAKPLIVRVQVKDLGGRLSESGLLSGHISDQAKAMRVAARGSGTNCTTLGKPAAQQAAHAKKQQPPVQLRSEAGSVPAWPD